LQRMAVIQSVGPSSADATADDTDPDAAETARLAAHLAPDETHLLYSLCLHGRGELGLSPDEYAGLTMVLLRLLAFKPATNESAGGSIARNAPDTEKKSLIEPQTRPSLLEAKRVEPEAAAPAAAPAPPAEPTTSVDVFVASAAPPSKPAGQMLEVLSSPHTVLPAHANEKAKDTIALANARELATNIVAVPVRVQLDSRADQAQPQGATVSVVATPEGDFWHALVQQMVASEAIAAMVRELALQSQLVAQDTDQWILRVERESLNQAGSRDRLQAALLAAGHAVKLVIEVGRVTDSPGKRNAQLQAERQLAAEKIIFDDPFVQKMMRDFGGKIVPGSIKAV
jgi:DNA polymerase III subunit gamma/tau